MIVLNTFIPNNYLISKDYVISFGKKILETFGLGKLITLEQFWNFFFGTFDAKPKRMLFDLRYQRSL